ncbi:DUF4198 domain-containing protein [Croceicoccus sp. YJ47]|uniref:DUF4198 domain-containing protein n=1 Tax=Croceicoccus sp. YJ47 TaxID=2798724 RepID=UPI0019250AF4|nr:DUF4198 domain-containing protein [Croceicoccus sp. YJ47]QQN73390.1 DUF4198 domain-containing protein [Croceicoccus sp. YJ47]
MTTTSQGTTPARRLSRTLTAMALAGVIGMTLATPAQAHRRWLLPSATVLSGQSETVTVDAAISNALFNFDHHAAGLDDLVVTGPDGNVVAPAIIGTGKYRSVFDVPLDTEGTYRIALASEGIFGRYMLNGEAKRWRGTAAEADTAIPAGATEVQLTPVSSRVETFVTLGAPNETALQPTGKGIEMMPVTHPNDLIAGEPAQFRFLLDGEPAAMDIEFVKGDTRYRDEAGIETVSTDADGLVTLTAQVPGMYFIETSANADGGRRASYSAVLEFNPA